MSENTAPAGGVTRDELHERLLAIIESRRMEPWTDKGRPCCVMCGSRWDGEHKAECWVPTLREAAALLAPQEARGPEAEWIADYSRLLTAYKGAVIEYYGQPGRAGSVEAAKKMRAAREALDAHVLAAPAPETREPDIEALAEAVHDAYLATCARLGWDVKPANRVPYAELSEDSKELDRASVRAVLAGLRPAPEMEREPTQAEIDGACMWYRHDFGLMSDEDAGRLRFTAREWLRAWHKAGARELLGAPAPAEATEASDESARCTCEWMSPEDGSVHARWPAVLDARCAVHSREEAESEAALPAEATEARDAMDFCPTCKHPRWTAACQCTPASGEPSGAEAVVREALRDCEEVLRLIHEAAGPVPKDAPMPRTTSWGAWKAAREALGLPTAPGATEEGESDAE